MKQKPQVRLMEIAFLLIGIGALALGTVQTFGLAGTQQPARETILLVEENNEPLVADVTELTDSQLPLLDDNEPEEAEMGEEDDGGEETAVYDEEPEAEDMDMEEEEYDALTIAAQLIGIDVETLEAELFAGKSIAEVASSRNVAVQPIIDALIAQELSIVDAEVAGGQLGADEANEWREEITLFTPFMVNNAYLEPEVVAAQTIGVDMETFWEALESGQTIQAIAVANSIDAQTVIQAIVASEKAYADKMVAAGLMPREELAELEREVYQMADEMVKRPLSELEE
ncbi:MAG: hypothetical protein AAF614_02295 [Chloroflexota bacterium]